MEPAQLHPVNDVPRLCRSPSVLVLELSLFSKFVNEENSINDAKVPVVKQKDVEALPKRNFFKKIKFIISCIGFSVGLGNAWRFPYLCYLYGGGSFLIPYSVMVIFVGLPLFGLEMAIGQYFAKSPIVLFSNLCPLFCGIGPAMLIMTLIVIIYYNVLLAWTLYYMLVSFSKELPWSKCDFTWGSKDCISSSQVDKCLADNMTFWNMSCYSSLEFCHHFGYHGLNVSHCYNHNNTTNVTFSVGMVEFTNRVSAAEDYFRYHILDTSAEISDLGYIRWQLALCLLVAWFFVVLCLIRGTYISGYVVYVTAVVSSCILVVLLVRSVMLEGAGDGVMRFVTPDFQKLYNPKIWCDAAVQVLFSLGATFGIVISLASYNRFNNDCLEDAVTVVLCDVIVSVLSALISFSVIGYMSHELNLPFQKAVRSVQSLAFIAYPEAVSHLNLAPIWSFLFFALMFCLGLDSQYTAVESIRTTFEDAWPVLRKHRVQMLLILCSSCFFFGLPMTTKAGIYIFSIFDEYAVSWSMLTVGILNSVVVTWFYGFDKKNYTAFQNHIEDMIKTSMSRFWMICWKFLTPLILFALLISQFLVSKGEYADYKFPLWADVIGWIISSIPGFLVLLCACYKVLDVVLRNKPLKDILHSPKDWGPTLELSN